MRQFSVIAAVAAALLAGGAAAAKEKPAEPKPKKVCRTEQMPGRITPKRICRIVTPSAAQVDPDKAGDGRATSGRGN
jgi:hypothetical protein